MLLSAALASGLVDVPLILTTMRDEDDNGPNQTIVSWSQAQLDAFLDRHFTMWSNTTGAAIAQLYADVSAADAGQAYYDLDADTGVGCGHIVIATAAGQGYKSPVYLGVNMHSPSSPFQSSTFPFHEWDYFSAVRVRTVVVLPARCTRCIT